MASPALNTEIKDLRALDAELAQMAAAVESQLAEAISAFESRDVSRAQRAIETDRRIDEYHRGIEFGVLSILRAFRLDGQGIQEVMAAMKVSGELERIGDLAKNVAKRTLVLSELPPIGTTAPVARMGRTSLRQVAEVLNAYAARNLNAAHAVWGGDDDLDELYNSVFEEILVTMMNDGRLVSTCTHLGFVAKNFERVGDHATNIAETLHFLVTGDLLTDDRPKGDETSTKAVKAI
ncbi:MAG: phosphate signaling complex protein PhoU [Pseudomonadota bacterium]